ncbi:hypothetical protein K0U91_08265 [Chryseobacterium chendengshani]|uniref:hypothetical protein n=1 Tax=Chryseobacterium sp. LJ668 TaxID=2864040 RepID=UPI001C6941F0|nr:hypothetical protein [Chryseobacterium sp. LJ668]MBW8524685.1 hypothetical protein [Chryseobacterium sp. LJ668]QYK15083.1 hypothetical protein K0U91_08265 [Chryseobacterium sp. LJ668]
MNPFLRIEKPCTESLENMHDVSEGKFCDLCSKTVIDFSHLNKFEITNIIIESRNKKVCGIFFKNHSKEFSHEEKEISYPARKTEFSMIVAGLALTASIINSYPAQTKNLVQKEFVNTATSKKEKNQVVNKNVGENFTISGRIISGDKQQPISATVSFITISKVYTTNSDKDGYYSLEVPKEILKFESLLEFNPNNYVYDNKLSIYTIKELGKKQLIKLDYNGLDKMMGEVSSGPPSATEKSLIVLDGKKIDHKSFNKSYWMYYSRYDIHYIPKEYVKFFTSKEQIEDIYIVFVKPK